MTLKNKPTEHKIAYTRVSTVDQNATRQLEGMEFDMVYKETCSGKSRKRPTLELMLSHLRPGDSVFVHSIDRLARNLRDLRDIVDQILSKGAKITFVHEGLTFDGNEDNPMSMLMLNMMGAFAEFERNMIVSRVREGIAASPKKSGRPEKFTTEQKQEIAKLTNLGVAKAKIARQFDTTRMQIHRIMAEFEANKQKLKA